MARKKERRVSYAWVWHLDVAVGPIRTWEAAQGREYTTELAENALDRQAHGGHDHELTPGMLDRRDHLFSGTTSKWIALAREELFGDLSDRSIFRRAQRRRERVLRRVCAEEECWNLLPLNAPKHRRFCNSCGTGAARQRR